LNRVINLLTRLNRKLFPLWIVHLRRELSDCRSVLDIGCGKSSPIQECDVEYSVGVELFEPYLQESKKAGIHNEYVHADIREVEFEPGSFDAVICLEVLEHLTKQQGRTLIEKMSCWARKKVIITTPNEYLQQDDIDDNPLQVHRSGWSAKELARLGFKVNGLRGYKRLRGYKGSIKYRPMLFWAKVSHISQKFTYYVPSLAFQLFAVKRVQRP